MSGDTIHVPADRFALPILAFFDASPLAYFATTGYDGGALVVRTDRPLAALSSGEQRLWGLLRSLVSGDLRELLAGADDTTLAALADLFAECWTGEAA